MKPKGKISGLVLKVYPEDVILIGDNIKIMVEKYQGTQTKVVIQAPRNVPIQNVKNKWNLDSELNGV